MNFDNASSVYFNNKEVDSIVCLDNNKTWYQKETGPLEFTFSGTTLTQNSNGSFTGTNMMIDYGDGTIESTTGRFGHTYSKDGTYQVKIYGITGLGNYCFYGCTGLTSITIPDNVISLGDYCFSRCTNLTSVEIPNGITGLGYYCFYGCTGLTSITIPSSITSLGNSCFRNCTSLTSIIIPSSITSLENYCFQKCTGLISMQLNWTTASTILTYNSKWISNTSSTLKLHIPAGTTQLYIDKGYPSAKIIDDVGT